MDIVGPTPFSPCVSLRSECPHCGFLPLCSLAHLELPDTRRLNDLVTHQRKIKRGEVLHYAAQPLGSLHVVRTGFMKTILTRDNGNEQVTGFSMTGDLLGLDAIATGHHRCDAVALEDSTLCGVRYADFEALGRTVPALQQHFHRLMSAEIARVGEHVSLLGSMNAKERAAAFLLGISKRFAARGYSGTCFRLPMTRAEIASHIGVKLETVCRVFSALQHDGIIATSGKNVELRDLARLEQALETNRLPRCTRHIGNAAFGSLAVSLGVT